MKRIILFIFLIFCTLSLPLYAIPPSPPSADQVGTLTNAKWCVSDGSTINCTEDAPAGSGDVTSIGDDGAEDCESGACTAFTIGGVRLGDSSPDNDGEYGFAGNEFLFYGGALSPSTNAYALGSATKRWTSLFLNDGAVINFNNGDVTLTHSANTLTVGGGNLAMGANNITSTGSLGATGAGKLLKIWSIDAEFTNLPTINGGTLATALSLGTAAAATLGTGAGQVPITGDYQAADTDLTYLAGFTPSDNVKTILNAANYAEIKSALTYYTAGDTIQTGSATSLPGTCTVGQLYIDTDADTDGSLYICVTTNTWKEVDDDGSAASFDVTSITGQTDNTTPATTATAVLAQSGSLIESTLAQIATAIGVVDWTADQGTTNIHAGNVVIPVPTTITVADTTDTTSYVGLFESATGDLGPKTDGGITYNAGTGMLTVTGLTAGTGGVTVSKQSGVAGDMSVYEANSTDTHGAGFRGPASITGDGAYRILFPNARASSANMVLAVTNGSETGSGTAADPYVQTGSWVDLDEKAPLANPQFTGVVDIPVDATTDAEGEITIDTTTNQVRYYVGAQRVLSPIQHGSFVITAPADTDDINIMKAPYGMTILGINCIVQGTTSATGQLQECSATGTDCADLDDDIACDADGAADDGSFTDSAIAANAWLRWKTTSLSGTPTFLTVTFRYLVVAD